MITASRPESGNCCCCCCCCCFLPIPPLSATSAPSLSLCFLHPRIPKPLPVSFAASSSTVLLSPLPTPPPAPRYRRARDSANLSLAQPLPPVSSPPPTIAIAIVNRFKYDSPIYVYIYIYNIYIYVCACICIRNRPRYRRALCTCRRYKYICKCIRFTSRYIAGVPPPFQTRAFSTLALSLLTGTLIASSACFHGDRANRARAPRVPDPTPFPFRGFAHRGKYRVRDARRNLAASDDCSASSSERRRQGLLSDETVSGKGFTSDCSHVHRDILSAMTQSSSPIP